MSRRTILRSTRPVTIQVILEGIVHCTNAHQGTNRPQFTTLRPVIANEIELPVYARVPADGTVGLIYCEACCPTVAPGEPPLILCLRPLPGHGAEHAGVFSGAIVVSVWQHPDYPLSPKEVEWSIAHDCGCANHDWSNLSECWEKLNEIADEDLLELVAQYEAGTGSPPGALPDALALNAANDESSSLPPEDGQETGQGGEQAAKKPKRKRKSDPSHRGTRQPRKAPSRFLMANMWHMDDL